MIVPLVVGVRPNKVLRDCLDERGTECLSHALEISVPRNNQLPADQSLLCHRR